MFYETEVEIEHIVFLTEIFQRVVIEGYEHSDEQDYKLIGMTLKKLEYYNMVQLMELLEYFAEHGLKKVTSMAGWLLWAFKNPTVAMQPYNTLNYKPNHGGANDDKKQYRKATGRNYYDGIFGARAVQ